MELEFFFVTLVQTFVIWCCGIVVLDVVRAGCGQGGLYIDPLIDWSYY